MFAKSWREEWVVLYDDSTLAWYKEKGRGSPEGCIVVKDAPELLAVSQWTMRIPGRPDLPNGSQLVQLMAFGTRQRDKVHWLLAQSEQEVNDWMTAITNTLPPPPHPPDKAPNLAKDSQLPPVPTEGENKSEDTRTQAPASSTPHETNNHTLTNGLGDFGTTLMMSTIANNWGNGHGWGVGWGWNDIYSHGDLSSYEIDTCTGADFSYDDVDYGMDCGGDFSF